MTTRDLPSDLKGRADSIAGRNSTLYRLVCGVLAVEPREMEQGENPDDYGEWSDGFAAAMLAVEQAMADVLGVVPNDDRRAASAPHT